jgi:hypothetical protein
MTIKLNKFNVTNGAHSARVTYSAFRMVSTGQECVTIYARDTINDLHKVFAAGYENATDGMSDYFEKGRVRILKGDPLYAAALARCSR